MFLRKKIAGFDQLELYRASQSAAEFPLHYHETFCISVITEGTLMENDRFITQHQILISHPFEVHDNSAQAESNVSFDTFYIAQDVLEYITGHKNLAFTHTVINAPNLSHLFQHLAQALVLDKSFEQCESAAVQALTALSVQFATKQTFEPRAEPDWVRTAKHLIDSNIDQKISLDALAKVSGLSKFQFIRKFQQSTGLSPFEYVLLRRVIRSQAMLRQGKPLVHTALDAGFYDQSHFSHYFKKYTGVAPGAYQKGCNILQD